MKSVEEKQEIKLLGLIFLLFAVAIMAWIPRFPEFKENLDLTNGQFGTLLSTGTFGAVMSLLIMGHVVHKYGVKKVLIANSLFMVIAFNIVVHTHSPLIFLICNVAIAFGISGFHIATSGQAFHTIDRIKGIDIARFHGIWAVGALLTALLSGLIVNYISLAWHIGSCVTVCFLAIALILQKMTPVLLKPNESPDSHLPLRTVFSSFKIDRMIVGGLLCASLLEYCTADWVAIYGKEEVGVSAGLASVPYILFMLAMIIGRLSAKKLDLRFKIEVVVQVLSIVGGFGFIAFLLLASAFSSRNQSIAFIFTCIAFTFAGAGSSLIAPAIYTAANKRSELPSAIVVGQVGVINNILIFAFKATIAWTAQITGSLTIALVIPAVLMASTVFFAKVTKKN
jgi:MFS family permease